MKLTIVVCTTGKREELFKCLQSIKKHPDVEVLVINNGQKKMKPLEGTTIIHVPESNLSRARNVGWEKAHAAYVAYIDDDSIADASWVKRILTYIQKHPDVIAFGGPYGRYSLKPIPLWVPQNFGQMNWGRKAKVLSLGKEWLTGTNMIFAKNSLKKIGGFNEALGMKGDVVDYGEEIEVQIKLASLGVPIHYDPSIKVSHLIDTRKLRIFWMCKDAYIRGMVSEKLKQTFKVFFGNSKRQMKTHGSSTMLEKVVSLVLFSFFALGVIKQKVLHEKI